MARTDNRPHCKSSALVLAWLFAAALVGGVPARGFAEVKPFSANFKAREMAVTGGTLHVRVGGSGPAVLLLHGFGDTGDMWQPLAEILGQGSHGHRPRSSRHGIVVASRRRVREDESGSRHRENP